MRKKAIVGSGRRGLRSMGEPLLLWFFCPGGWEIRMEAAPLELNIVGQELVGSGNGQGQLECTSGEQRVGSGG